MSDVERVLNEALATKCPECGTEPEHWCFEGPKLHARRILERDPL